MVEVRKRDNESTGSMLRRFNKMLQQSGFLVRARGGRYRVSPKSDYQRKKEALRRVAWQKEMNKMRKLGKIQ